MEISVLISTEKYGIQSGDIKKKGLLRGRGRSIMRNVFRN